MARRSFVSGLTTAVSLAVLFSSVSRVGAIADTLPNSISDRDFWNMTEQLSEPNGYFVSDNLVSNEMTLSTVANALADRMRPGGVYLGVGPEQNFTYIAAMRPKMAFITDIRRGNLHMHLMYKALFELSANRSEFVSRLLTKPKQPGLTSQSTAAELMNAYWDVKTSEEPVYQKNLAEIYHVLTKAHGWALSQDDRDGIAYVYHAFYWYGPSITYGSSSTGVSGRGITYADLMMSVDSVSQRERSFLATEEAFTAVKQLEMRNLILPVVGDFAGPKALRGVGQYLKEHDAKVNAFYVSNVESYLRRNGVWQAFCANVATLPIDETSIFIRPNGIGFTPTAATALVGATPPGSSSGAYNSSVVPLAPGPNMPQASPFGTIVNEVSGCTVR